MRTIRSMNGDEDLQEAQDVDLDVLRDSDLDVLDMVNSSQAELVDDEPYPPDPDDDGDGDEEASFPTPRAARVRGAVLQQKPGGAQVMAPKRRAAKRLLAMEKRRKAYELRKAGATYQQIADTVGYHDAGAARKAVLKMGEQVVQEPVQEFKTLQIERVNHMMMAIWGQVQSGDQGAIRTATLLMDKLDRYMGTEQAQQVDINVNHKEAILVIDGDKDSFIKSMQRMAGMVESQVVGTSQDQGPSLLAIEGGTKDSARDGLVTGSVGYVTDTGETEAVLEGEIVEVPGVPNPAPSYDFGVDP